MDIFNVKADCSLSCQPGQGVTNQLRTKHQCHLKPKILAQVRIVVKSAYPQSSDDIRRLGSG